MVLGEMESGTGGGVCEVDLKRYTCREVKKAGWSRGRH